MVLRQLLKRLDKDEWQFRKTLQACNALSSMMFTTAKRVNGAQDNSNSKPTVTVQRSVYHYIAALISPQQIKHTYALVYVHDTGEVEKSRIRGSNFSQKLGQNIFVDLATVITWTNPKAQYFQTLRE